MKYKIILISLCLMTAVFAENATQSEANATAQACGQAGDSAQCVGDAALMPFNAIGNEINSTKW